MDDNSLYYRMTHQRQNPELENALNELEKLKEYVRENVDSKLNLTEADKRWLKEMRICV